jgi:pimeloyl-ACP methyl ester carboxylesterase
MCGESDGKPLIFIHGFGTDASRWDYMYGISPIEEFAMTMRSTISNTTGAEGSASAPVAFSPI